jgi:zinc transport system ATP-binding protein
VLVSDSVVEIDHLHVAIAATEILPDLSLTVARGDVLALLGANGSGKSTLVRAMLGLTPVSGGRIALFGTALPEFQAWHRIGYVPQRVTAGGGVPATVAEVVSSGRLDQRSWWRRLRPVDRDAVSETIAAVGLSGRENDSVRELSGGQQQRVLIARALVRRPDLLLLDEPTAGVDQASQDAFAQTLRRLVDDGTTVVVVLHELGSLAPLIARSIVLRRGRVVHDGGPPVARDHHADLQHDHVHPHATADDGWL